MNLSTFFICENGILTFRLIGFGILAFREGTIHMFPKQRDTLWLIPIWPGWRFALVGPWH